MKLVLVRHAEAGPVRSSDAERALTYHGNKQAALTAKWLQGVLAGEGHCLVLASPYRRAQETAAVLAEVLRVECRTLAAITPDEDARRALQAIVREGTGADVLVVVTHMPLVASLAGWLETGNFSDGQGFGLAEARIFVADELGAAQAGVSDHFIPGVTG